MILHVGMHKTGTSSIQRALAEALVDERFHFMQLAGYPNGSLIIGNAYAGLEGYPHHPDSPPELRRLSRRNAMKTITTELNAFDGRIPILSAELICSLEDDAKRALLDLLTRYHPELRIAAYIRRPKSYLESAYPERLKICSTRIDEHVENIQYQKIFSAFEVFLGMDRVNVRPFDAGSLHDGDVVADFAATWGIAIDMSRVTRENEALSLEAVKLLYMYRLAVPWFRQGDEHVIALLSDLGGEKFRLHSSLFRKAALMEPADIDWVNEHMNWNVAEDLTVDDDRAIRTDAEMLDLNESTRSLLAERLGLSPSQLRSPADVAEALARHGEKMSRADG
jgi:hypothetical protein